jgi:hypothetical protein
LQWPCIQGPAHQLATFCTPLNHSLHNKEDHNISCSTSIETTKQWVEPNQATYLKHVLPSENKRYSLRFHIRSHLGQRHGHQSTTLTSLFYKNIYSKVIYVYSYESNFQDKSIYMIFTFSNSTT